MAVPARKTSKTRKRNRRGHIKLTVPGLAPCPNCGELRKSWFAQAVVTTTASKLLKTTNHVDFIRLKTFLEAPDLGRSFFM